MRMVMFVIALVLGAGPVFAQQADPTKSVQTPWQVDPRCAVMSAHMYNQGALTSACLPAAGATPYLNQTPGHQSQTQSQTLRERSRPVDQPPPNRE